MAVDSSIVTKNLIPVPVENRKIFKGDGFIIATAGLTYGQYIVERLLNSVKNFQETSLDYLVNYLIKIGSGQYLSFIGSYKKELSEELLRLYFVIAGFDETRKMALKMVGSEGNSALREFKVTDIVTIPKRISVEFGLLKIKDRPKKEIIEFITESLNKIKDSDPTVTPPFHFELIER